MPISNIIMENPTGSFGISSKKEHIAKLLHLRREKILKLLKMRSFKELIITLSQGMCGYLQEKTKYDIFTDVMPYENDVSHYYNTEYVNASFIDIIDNRYIACQEPKEVFTARFLDFVFKVNPVCIICFKSNPSYLNQKNIISIKKIKYGEDVIIEEIELNINTKNFKLIICPIWTDHSILERGQMDFIWSYIQNLNKGIKIVHCRAGVGRTGTFIMFEALKSLENVTFESFVDILISLREQRHLMVQSVSQLRFLADYFLDKYY